MKRKKYCCSLPCGEMNQDKTRKRRSCMPSEDFTGQSKWEMRRVWHITHLFLSVHVVSSACW